MKVETSQVTKIVITDVPRLDPISMYLEDFGPGQGKAVIECYGESWAAYWGAMGDNTIAEFVRSCSNDYLSSKFAPSVKSEITDVDSIPEHAAKEILRNRRSRDLTKDKARELYEEVEWNSGEEIMSTMGLCHDIYGDEWWYVLPTMSNPEYEYLSRILDAVKDALDYIND